MSVQAEMVNGKQFEGGELSVECKGHVYADMDTGKKWRVPDVQVQQPAEAESERAEIKCRGRQR